MFRHGEIVRTGGSLGEHTHLVDEVGDELAPADLEDLDGLSRGLERGAVAHRVARRTVAIYQYLAFRFETNV
jgi:hypothetical protein